MTETCSFSGCGPQPSLHITHIPMLRGHGSCSQHTGLCASIYMRACGKSCKSTFNNVLYINRVFSGCVDDLRKYTPYYTH